MCVQWDKEWKTLAVENEHRPMNTYRKCLTTKQQETIDIHLEVCVIKPKETKQ